MRASYNPNLVSQAAITIRSSFFSRPSYCCAVRRLDIINSNQSRIGSNVINTSTTTTRQFTTTTPKTVATMKEAIVRKGTKIEIVDVPIPTPKKDQVVIKVEYSGSNPKDWKYPEMTPKGEVNQGDDIAGTIHAVGEGVSEFKVGDRVHAFHEMISPHGSWGEYAVAWSWTTAYLPDHVSFKEGAALPLASLTSAVGLYDRLNLPLPWQPRSDDSAPLPFVIYGASSSIGYYALQFALRSNIHPLICIAGNASAHVEKLIDRSKGDVIVDYRSGDAAIQSGIKAAIPAGSQLLNAFDGVSDHNSFVNIGEVMADGGNITTVLPGKDYSATRKGVNVITTMVGDVHHHLKDFGYVFYRYIARGVDEGWFRPQPQQEIPGGLTGIQEGLINMRDGKASAVKYVFKIADTPGAGQ